MRVAAFSHVGRDSWEQLLRTRLAEEGVEPGWLQAVEGQATSATVVLIDGEGERSFIHAEGALSGLDKRTFLDNLELFARSRMALVGYYSLLPQLDADLPEIFREIRQTGCRTAMDAAGTGGAMQPLDKILPHLDVYIPSLSEARHQTGANDPEAIIEIYRQHGAAGLLGVKLGADGALLSPEEGTFQKVAAIQPPGPVVDTTGAGDCFYAGMLTGLLHDMPLEQCGRLAAAAGAICVTRPGASAAIGSLESTMELFE